MDYFITDKANFKVIETGEGFLKAKISIARPGVFQYFYADGMRNEAKLPGDILSQATIDSAKGIPISDGHPTENGNRVLINTSNYKKYAKGNISEPKIENGHLTALATIYDSGLIEKIKRKEQNEASIGFKYKLDLQPGEYNGERFEVSQKDISINHVAMEAEGRAGENIKIHIDKKQSQEIIMGKWIVDGFDKASDLLTWRKFDGSEDVAVHKDIFFELQAIKTDSKIKQTEIDTLKTEKVTLTDQLTKVQADSKSNPEIQKLTDELKIATDASDQWKKKHDEAIASLPKLAEDQAKERFTLVEFAKSVNKDMNCDSLSNKEIQLQCIAKGLPFAAGIRAEDQSPEIINARFDAASELLRAKATMTTKSTSQIVGIDAKTIEEKKSNLQNQYQIEQEKIRNKA